MKILFLDIDGVLNSTQFYNNKSTEDLILEPLDGRCVLHVKSIVDATDARIVITSTWRGGWEKEASRCSREGQILNRFFKLYGLSIYDKTPVLPGRRGAEIRAYLDACPEKVTGYCIIDDNDFSWKKHHLHRHVIQTDFEDGGLKEEHAKKAIEILNQRCGLQLFR